MLPSRSVVLRKWAGAVPQPDLSFVSPFGTPPTIMIVLTGIGGTGATGLRAGIELAEVEMDEFNIVVHSRADTLLHGVV